MVNNLDIQAERDRLQAMLDDPQNALERSFRRDVLVGGSQPFEWSDETVSSAHYFYRIYCMGWTSREKLDSSVRMRSALEMIANTGMDARQCMLTATSALSDEEVKSP